MQRTGFSFDCDVFSGRLQRDRAVSDALLGLDNQKLRDAIDIYEYVTELLMESRNNSSLVMSLEHMLEKRVMYFDQNAEPIYISGFSRARIQICLLYTSRCV